MKNVIYEYWIDGLVVGIHDLHGKELVTVHAAGVLLELQQKIGSLQGKFVIWRNGDHLWDGFLYRNKRIGMYALGCTTFEAAKAALKVLPSENTRTTLLTVTYWKIAKIPTGNCCQPRECSPFDCCLTSRCGRLWQSLLKNLPEN